MPRKKKKITQNEQLDINSTQQLDEQLANQFNDDQMNDQSYDSNFQDQDEIDYLSQLQKEDQQLAKQMKKQRRSKEYYVKGKDLIEQIRKYQESLKNDPEGKGYISEQLGSMILKICTRFSLHPKFYGYTYRDQMQQML